MSLLTVGLLLVPLQKSALQVIRDWKSVDPEQEERQIAQKIADYALQRTVQQLRSQLLFLDKSEQVWKLQVGEEEKEVPPDGILYQICDPRYPEQLILLGSGPVAWGCDGKHAAVVAVSLNWVLDRTRVLLKTTLHGKVRYSGASYWGVIRVVERKAENEE